MKRGFYTIMAAQFFSSLADNALLVAAIALLRQMHEAGVDDAGAQAELRRQLRACSRRWSARSPIRCRRARVMLITNGIKIVGCALMLFHIHPLAAYAVVGLRRRRVLAGQVRHPDRAPAARSSSSSPTAGSRARRSASIILGVLLGGALMSPRVSTGLLGFDMPMIDTGIDTPPEAAIAIIMAALRDRGRVQLVHSRTPGVDHRTPSRNPFYADPRVLALRVPAAGATSSGQISLATTTLFWGAGATLQFIVIDWAARNLGFNLSQASLPAGRRRASASRSAPCSPRAA